MIRPAFFRFINILSKLKVHPVFWVILGLGIASGRFRDVVIVFSIVLIHELGHAIAADQLNWRIKKIELLPFGGVAEMDEHGNKPASEELFVILAGPLQHIWMYGAAYLLFHFQIWDEATYHMFRHHNSMILLFNLIPVWPLDGGKLLFSMISFFFPVRQARTIAIQVSLFLWMILVGVVTFVMPFHLNLWVVLAFILISHYLEWKQRNYHLIRFLLERCYREGLSDSKTAPVFVRGEEKLYDVMSRFYRGRHHRIFLKNSASPEFIDEDTVLRAYFIEKKTGSEIRELFS